MFLCKTDTCPFKTKMLKLPQYYYNKGKKINKAIVNSFVQFYIYRKESLIQAGDSSECYFNLPNHFVRMTAKRFQFSTPPSLYPWSLQYDFANPPIKR